MQTEKPQVLDRQVPALSLWLARTGSSCSFNKLPAFSLKFMWSCWEADERKKEREEAEGVQTCLGHADEVNCKYNNDFTKWMFLHQKINWPKCCVCCVESRSICCVHCFCLYLFAWTPASQTSTQKERRWVMRNCIARTYPWQTWKEVTTDTGWWERPQAFGQGNNSKGNNLFQNLIMFYRGLHTSLCFLF